MDSLAGMDMKKIEEMVTTALMLDSVAHDETIMVNVLKEA
jgi:hypothetical protein